MKETNLHMVPQAVLDCASNVFNPDNNAHTRETYVMRIEAIRDYCNDVIAKHQTNKPLTLVKKPNLNVSRMRR